MSRSIRSQLQRAAARDTILDAAREVIVKEGHEGLSMRALAARIGCSPGTLYLYFENKNALLDCLIEDAFEKLLEVLEDVHDTGDPVRSLRNKLRAYVDFGLRYPNHYHFAFLLRATGGRANMTIRPHAAFEVLRVSVSRCIRETSLEWPDVETTSQVLWTMIHGITSLLIVRPNFPWVDRNQLIDQLLETAINGLNKPAKQGRGKRGTR